MSEIFLTDTDRADIYAATFAIETIGGVGEIAESFFNKDGSLDTVSLDFTHIKEIRAALVTLAEAIAWLHAAPTPLAESISDLLERNGIRASVMQVAIRSYITAAHQCR